MSLIKWLFGGRSARSAALSLYKHRLRCTKKQDQHGAMEGFTAAIKSPGAPDDLRAMTSITALCYLPHSTRFHRPWMT